jgi:nucleoside-diphosphate-sugar epimerase
VLLLTGATGLVGSELLRRLPCERLLIVARGAMRGDVTRPGLGLSAGELALVRRTVTDVVHCAADTRFTLPLSDARRTNVDGTRHVIELAHECRRLRRLAHVSTLFVVGRSTGTFDELPLRHANGWLNTYQQSKYEAEDLVLDAMRRLPAAIVRLGSIAGDSRTGHVRQFNYVHRLLRLFPRGILPVVPGDPGAPIDLIPHDWAGAALAHLLDHRFAEGGVYHLCGGEESLTVAELMEIVSAAFRRSPPALVPLAEYEAYAAEARRKGDALLTEVLRALDLFLPHMGMRQSFRTATGLRPPPARDYFGKVVRYCIDTHWGRRPLGRISPNGSSTNATREAHR